MLNANSETEFQIMCSVTDTIVDQQLTGKYQVFVSLLIDDIPRASLTNDDGTVLKIANEANPELVTVQVVVLEVISEYKGKEYINLDVYPKIVDLNSYQYKLGDGMCVEETVNFKNKGKLPVTVSWIRPDEHSCVDNNLAPESLVVDDRAIVRVLIDPRGSGRLRHILRFRATNIDGSSDVVVYVRGLVEQPQVIVRPTTLPRLGILCAGTLATYRTEFTSGMNNFELITKRLYRFNGNDEETWQPHSEQSFGSCTEGIGVKNMIYMSINYETVVNTQTNGISCELTEWTFAECHNVYNQTVAVVKPPDVQFNQRIVSFHRPLYKGVTHRHKGICLFNNTRCGLTYCWGNPLETVANNVHCWLEPANGVVDGDSSVEFELVVIPKTAGLHNKFSVPCFIQNAAVPEQITVEFTAKGFGAQVSYVDSTQVYRKIQWPHDEEQWSDVNREDEPCDYENIEAEDFFSLDDTVLRMPPNQSFKFELFEENEFE
ncbi:uncharacterized protein LOC126846274 [Adelges cooleyi]|uniref:uncharacterized protein LOC126846274 n=1 Tax=Adelges cooleyi TaxID=133065 RepID=UPI00217F4AAD|nr:uncharacterized protein LOC126846274 [Adelges cooleyi]